MENKIIRIAATLLFFGAVAAGVRSANGQAGTVIPGLQAPTAGGPANGQPFPPGANQAGPAPGVPPQMPGPTQPGAPAAFPGADQGGNPQSAPAAGGPPLGFGAPPQAGQGRQGPPMTMPGVPPFNGGQPNRQPAPNIENRLENLDENAFAAPPQGLTPPPPTPKAFVPSVIEKFEKPSGVKFKTAILRTSLGDLTIRLFMAQAPRTVRNFMQLATGEKDFVDAKTSKKVRRPFYNGLIFFRVIKGFMIQTGCPFGNGRGDPGYTLPDETSPSLKFDRPGLVAMALEQTQKPGTYRKDSNGSQFFITLAPEPSLDVKSFTIFGEVTSGLDVARKIGNTRTGPTDRPIKKVYLYSVEIQDPDAQLIPTAPHNP